RERADVRLRVACLWLCTGMVSHPTPTCCAEPQACHPHLRFLMPTYVYEILDKKGKPTGKTFEIVQSMKEDALTEHPKTGEPVRRAIVAPNIAGNWSDMK